MPETTARPPFFVYGTLRPGGANHTPALAARLAAVVPARMDGIVLHHGPGYPYALDGAPGDTAHGALLLPGPDDHDEVLAALDHLEEYRPGDPGSLYERVVRRARTAQGVQDAWVYLAGPAVRHALRTGGRRVAGGDWQPAGRTRPAPDARAAPDG